MKTVLIDPIPLGSRWELFLKNINLETYLNNAIEKPIAIKSSERYGGIISEIEDSALSCLIFYNSKLTSAYPFFFDCSCSLKVNLKKIEYSNSGEAFVTIEADKLDFKAFALDYVIFKEAYKKKMTLYLTATAYNFSQIVLQNERVTGLVKPSGFLPDEYTMTGKILDVKDCVFRTEILNLGIKPVPVLAKEIYFKKPEISSYATGDAWFSCFTEDFKCLIKEQKS